MRYAVIDSNNKVINIVKANEPLADNWVQSDIAQIGWIYDKEQQIFKPEPIPLDLAKQNKEKELANETKNYIESYYSELKQRSDITDKEYWGAWLITHFSDTYTTDNLYQKFFNATAKIVEGTLDFNTEVSNLKEVTTFTNSDEKVKYSTAIEQLLKVSIRQGWVQACKVEYKIKSSMVKNTKTLDELNSIELNLPKYPLKE